MVDSKEKIICKNCSKEYIYLASFNKHVNKCHSKKNSFKPRPAKKYIQKFNTPFIEKTNWIPEFSFSDDFFDTSFNEEIIPSGTETYLDQLEKFCFENKNDLNVLHLNINSVFLKIDAIHDILNSNSFDIIFLNETKLDKTVPDSYLSHMKYTLHRRDRDFTGTCLGRNGGGLLIFIRKTYIHTLEVCSQMEAMLLRVTHNKCVSNFLACYKSPSLKNVEFIEFLDAKVSTIDLSEPIFIIGDLNMDLNSVNGKLLQNFILDFNFQNFIYEPTRTQAKIMKRNTLVHNSSTLLDVMIHNKSLISSTVVIDCPFSDHKFIAGSIKLDKQKPNECVTKARNLSEKNLNLLSNILANKDFSQMDKLNSCDDKWLFLKNSILLELDKVCPLKKITMKSETKCPWFDLELTKAKTARDTLYAIFAKSKSDHDRNRYKEARINFQYLNRSKIKQYFEKKGINDFKNSRRFWKFYKSSIKLRSDKTGNDAPNLIIQDNEMVSEPMEIASLFNNFFTSIESVSLSRKDESIEFIESHINSLKTKGLLKTSINGFSFKRVDVSEVEKLFRDLSTSSSPGISGIHPKILKLIPDILLPIFTELFNYCISTNSIPKEWKLAVVTPLYKNKGKRSDLNNYRGISILSPISKIFEKLLSHQITDYF